MYQALYRKWRPKVFEDVYGQPQITAALRGELTTGHVAHAYLFTGSRGTGKTTCAKIMAKAVNCLHPKDGDPCNECENCRGIDAGTLLDVVEIDAASNNGVDSIRDLREETAFTPASAKYRVYIIDEAHMLSQGAFNALLKTLEEPPAYVIFILATTEIHKIPATILSRCQRFDFHRIPPEDIAARLSYIAQQEKMALAPQAAALIARLADGALRDALSLLDQCAARAGETIDEQTVYAAAGLAGQEYLAAFAEAFARGDADAAVGLLDRLYAASKDLGRLCEELLLHLRNILLVKTVKDPFAIIRCTPEEEAPLREAAESFDAGALLHMLDALQQTLDRLRRSPAPRVEMEMCLLRLCRPELDTSPAALLRRIERLESRPAGQEPAADRQPADEKAAPRPSAPVKSDAPALQNEAAPAESEPTAPAETAAPPDPGEESAPPHRRQPAKSENADTEDGAADEPLACWPEILEDLAQADAPLCGVLNASSAIVRGGHVLVDAPNSLFPSLIRQQSHRKALVESIRKITGEPYKVGVFKKSLAKAPKADDPFDEILRNANAAGIEIQEK